MKRRDFVKTGTVGLGGIALASGVSAPVVAANRIDIAMVSTWPRDFPGLGTGAQRFAKRLSDMTNGRMNVSYYASGERAKAFDSFDAVASGTVQIYHGAAYYWTGNHPSFAYFTAVPFGMTGLAMNACIRFGGGP